MAGHTRGIEIFGRGATVVEYDKSGVRSRTLGALAIAVASGAIVALVAAIHALVVGAARGGDSEAFAIAALVASVLGAVLGLAALLSGRGRLLGFVALLLSFVANPWVLHRVLDWAATL